MKVARSMMLGVTVSLAAAFCLTSRTVAEEQPLEPSSRAIVSDASSTPPPSAPPGLARDALRDLPWTSTSIDAATGVGTQLSVTFRPFTSPLVPMTAYYDGVTNGGDLKFATLNASGAWVPETVLSTADDEGNASSIVYDYNSSTTHIIHYDQTNSTWEHAWGGPGSWQHETIEDLGVPGAFGNDSGAGFHGPQNRIYVAYPDVGSTGIRFAERNVASGPWTITSYDVGLNFRDLDLVVAQGTAHLAYIDSDNSDLHYATRTSGGAFTSAIAQTDVSCIGCTVSLALDSQGRPHIVYTADVPGGALVHTWLDGGSWFRETIDTASTTFDFFYFSLKIDGLDNLHLAYQKDVGQQLRYAKKVGGTWSIEDVTAMESGTGGKKVGLFLTGSCPSIVHADLTGGTLEYAFPAGGSTLLVPADHASIREAVSFACSGDTVLVSDGTYSEDTVDFLGKDLALISQNGPDATIIDIGDMFGSVFLSRSFFTAKLQGRVEGFTIRNARGIRCSNVEGTIENCVVQAGDDANTFSASGIDIVTSNMTVSQCVVSGNLSRGAVGAIKIWIDCQVDIVSSTIAGNRGQQGTLATGGIIVTQTGSTVNLDQSIVWGNCTSSSQPDQILVLSGNTMTITDCVVDSAGVGGTGTIIYAGDNAFTDPLFCGPEDCNSAPTTTGDYTLNVLSPAHFANNPLEEFVGALGEGCTPIGYATPNTAGNSGTLSLEVTMTGDFGSLVNSAILVSPTAVVVNGTSITSSGPDDFTADFDLTGAETGGWDLFVDATGFADTLEAAVVVYTDSVELTRATTHPADDLSPSVSPAGATAGLLAFSSDRESTGFPRIMLKDPTAPDAVFLPPLGMRPRSVLPSWSGDGTKIVHDDPQASGLFVIDPFNPADTTVVTLDDFPAWSPVDNQIAFLQGGKETFVGVVNSDGTGRMVFFDAGTPKESPDWSPDGKRLIFSEWEEPGVTGWRILTRSALAGAAAQTPLTSGTAKDTDPAWSPDGRWVAISSDRDGDFEIYALDPRGESFGIVQITDDDATDHEPTWDSNGRILFTSDRSGNDDVFVASSLPIDFDDDNDAVPDVLDACLGAAPGPGEIDRDANGCGDITSSPRSIRFWGSDKLPLMFEMDPQGDPRIMDSSDFVAIDNAFNSWATLPGLSLSVQGDTTGTADAVAFDGRNIVTFFDARPSLGGYLALACVASVERDTLIGGRWYTKGEIVDTDLLFNKETFSFSTDTYAGDNSLPVFDLESVAAHEAGHAFGFAHSADTTATMFYVVPSGTAARSLQDDDAAVAARVYAASTPTLSIKGRVLRHPGLEGVKAAVVFAQDPSDATIRTTFTDANGEYRFFDLPVPYKIFVHPFDGSDVVGGLRPGDVNALVDSLAFSEEIFPSEHWDEAAESESDTGTGFVVVSTDSITDADIILNTDGDPPGIGGIVPAEGSADVAATSLISVRFDERIRGDSLSVNASSVRLELGPMALPGIAGLVNDDSVLVFRPDEDLAYDLTYTFTIGPGILDLFGNAMTDSTTVSFTIESQPPLSLTGLSRDEIPVGGVLTIEGLGFDPDIGDNVILFNSDTVPVEATPFEAALDRLKVIVPETAASGSLQVSANAEFSDMAFLTILEPKSVPRGNRRAQLPLPGAPEEIALTGVGTLDLVYVATELGISGAEYDSTGVLQGSRIDFAIPGGCVGVATVPGGRALAVSPDPPMLRAFDGLAATETADLLHVPRGIASVPGGAEVLIAYEDRVVLHEALAGPSFGDELRTWMLTDDSLLGDITVSPSASEAFVSTGEGRVLVLGLRDEDADFVNELTDGIDPREIAVTPDGARFLAVDETGSLRLSEVRGSLLQTLTFSGRFRGVTISPEGDFAYAADFLFNRVRVLDLRGENLIDAGFFETDSVAVDPRDLATGRAGRYIYVASSQPPLLELYDTVAGPRIDTVSPRAGGPGTILTVAGAGFASTPGDNEVRIGGTLQTVLSVNGDSTLFVRQESGALSGALVVKALEETSNGRTYRVVSRTDPGSFEVGSRFVTGAASPAYLTLAPGGSPLFALHDNGSLSVIDLEPPSATAPPSASVDFQRPLQVLTPGQTMLGAGAPLTMTPGGGTLYAVDTVGGRAAAFSFNELDNSLAFRAHVLDTSDGTALAPSDLAATPDGRRVLVASLTGGVIYDASTATDETTARFTSIASPHRIVVHALGARAYVSDGTSVRVLDVDPGSPGFGTVLTSVPVSGASDAIELAATPDGRRLLAYSTGAFITNVIDTEDGSPTLHTVIATPSLGSGTEPVVLALNRSGTLLFVTDRAQAKQDVYDLSSGVPVPVAGEANDASLSGTRSMVLSTDDARLYSSTSGDSLLVTSLTPAPAFAFQIGPGDLIGVVNQPLPRPLDARVTGTPQSLMEGTLVTFETSAPGAGFGGPDNRLYAVADEQGSVQADFIAGSTPGVAPITVSIGNSVFAETLLVVADTTLTPPQIIALQPDSGDTTAVTTYLGADFSKAIDPATVNASSFRLVSSSGTINGTVSSADEGRRLVFNPAEPLEYATAYTFELSVGDTLRDGGGNPLDPRSVPFTTIASPISPSVEAVCPGFGPQGAPVTLIGDGFSTLLSENTVFFGGTSALPARGDPRFLTTSLPGAAAGSLGVFVVVGAETTNAVSFEVLVPPTNSTLRVQSETDIPESGRQIVVLPDHRAYITSPGTNSVIPLIYRTGVSEEAIPVGSYPFSIVASPRGERLYVSNYLSNTVSVIDSSDPASPTYQKVIATIPAGERPTDLAVDPVTRSLYILNQGDEAMTIVDTDSTHATYNLARSIGEVGSATGGVVITPDGGLGSRVVVGTSFGFRLLDPETGDTLEDVDLGASTRTLAARPGPFVLVLTTDDRLFLVDLRSEGFTGARDIAELGSATAGLVISPDGGFAFVSSPDGFLTRLGITIPSGQGALPEGGSTYELELLDTVNVGENPLGLGFDPADPARLLTVNSGSRTVTVLTYLGDVEEAAVPVGEVTLTPGRFDLYANFPNPWEFRTNIRYDVPRTTEVTLRIYDVTGRLVRTLENRTRHEPGRYTIPFDGTNQNGRRISSGIYFYRLEAGDFSKSRKMVYLR